MRTTSIERRLGARRAAVRGFTLAELILVMVIIGVLSVVALPSMGSMLNMGNDTWRQDVVTALRQARATAASSRRLVCANVSTGAVTLTLASANPATTCNTPIAGLDGSGTVVSNSNAPATTALTLYYQPAGTVSTDGAGLNVVNTSITVAGETTITVAGQSGYVQ